jgi:hypothetical protein
LFIVVKDAKWSRAKGKQKQFDRDENCCLQVYIPKILSETLCRIKEIGILYLRGVRVEI